MGVDNKVLSLARLSEKGQLTIPAEHRPTHHLERLDELELSEMVMRARAAREVGDTVSHKDVKKRIGLPERESSKRRPSGRAR